MESLITFLIIMGILISLFSKLFPRRTEPSRKQKPLFSPVLTDSKPEEWEEAPLFSVPHREISTAFLYQRKLEPESNKAVTTQRPSVETLKEPRLAPTSSGQALEPEKVAVPASIHALPLMEKNVLRNVILLAEILGPCKANRRSVLAERRRLFTI